MRGAFLALASLFLVSVSETLAATPQYTLTDLGRFPGGGYSTAFHQHRGQTLAANYFAVSGYRSDLCGGIRSNRCGIEHYDTRTKSRHTGKMGNIERQQVRDGVDVADC